jgi:hypothetical protein
MNKACQLSERPCAQAKTIAHGPLCTAGMVRCEALEPRWIGSLSEVQDVNLQLLEALSEDASSGRPDTWALVRHLRSSFCAMTTLARERAARCAFLLAHVRFMDSLWWDKLPRMSDRSSLPFPDEGMLPRKSAARLARATLTVAWHTVRSDRAAAEIMLGMTAAVARRLAGLSLRQLDRIADGQHIYLRPRWEDRPAVWLQLLQASQTQDFRAVRDFSFRGLKLIAGELLGCPAAQAPESSETRATKRAAPATR